MKTEFYVLEVGSLLLTHEKILEQQALEVESFSSNTVAYQKKFNQNISGQRQYVGGNNRASMNFRSGRGQFNGRARGGRFSQHQNRPQCQLYGRFGHTVMKCFHRYDQNFQPAGYSQGGNAGYSQ